MKLLKILIPKDLSLVFTIPSKKITKIFSYTLLILFSTISFAQPWNYDFGTSTGSYSTSSSSSLTFLPNPAPGGGADSRVRIGNGVGSFNLENFSSQSYLRAVAPTNNIGNKFSVYDYTAGKSFTIRFRVRFGASDGSATGAASGQWVFAVGDGTTYSDNNAPLGTESFIGLLWTFGSGGAITAQYNNGGIWSVGSPTIFSQGITYTVDIYGNNSTSTINYDYGVSQSVAANTFDLWVDGILIGNDLSKAQLGNNVDIDSWMFYGINSTGNVANIFLDDIVYSNTIASSPLPVELSSFSASVVGSSVKLNWKTATEVNNYGFEVERKVGNVQPSVGNWEKLGFVNGNGNSNSPKNYSFIDENVLSGKYSFRLKQIDNDGTYEFSKVIEIDVDAPVGYELSQNYPNPFNPATTIKFNLPESEVVKIVVYDILGTAVKTLVNEFKEAGIHTINFNASEFASGTYVYRIETSNYVDIKKMLLIK